MIALAAFEKIIDASGAAPRIEAMLPIGVRPRQLTVRTLLAGMCLAQADHRPAHRTRVHQALVSLPEDDQRRLGVIADWKHGPHQLTYRQTEHTFGLAADAAGKDEPDGLPSGQLQGICDDLLEASIPDQFKDASASLAGDWTDLESFSRPPPARGGPCADPEASWGHRKNNLLRSEDELFYGYYFSAGIMMPDENGPAVPEFARRAIVSSCRHDPVRAFAPVLTAMPAAGIPLGDVLADSGYAHRDAGAWALPLRAVGAQLVQDLHPHDRGPKGTHHGAIIANGNLYCPATPRSLWRASHFPDCGSFRILSWKGPELPGKIKNYSPEFRDEAARLVVETSRAIADVARELGISETSLGNWVRAYREKHAEDEPPLQVSERARLRELERQNRELEMENTFLKKAAAYFAREHR